MYVSTQEIFRNVPKEFAFQTAFDNPFFSAQTQD